MVACATVSRTVASVSAVFSAFRGAVETTIMLLGVAGGAATADVQGQSWINGLVVPGAAEPGVFGVVDDLPGPFLARVRPSR